MNIINYYFWLWDQVVGSYLYLSIYTIISFIILLTVLFINILYNLKRNIKIEYSRLFFLLVQIIPSSLMILVGTFLKDTGIESEMIVVGIISIHITIAIWTVIRLRRMRLFAISASLWFMGLSLVSIFVSLMSITGDWI